jgi:low temperature requirement protein LtrA
MISEMTDIVPSFFATLNQGPLTLTIFLHTIIVLPMFWIYFSEKKRLEKES